jgi:O-antigen/teichoic acid export membrane protein
MYHLKSIFVAFGTFATFVDQKSRIRDRRALDEAAGFLRGAWPFFLLGLSGMVQSRVDLYVVNAFLQRGEVATYQVLTTMLIYVQTVSYVILSPFVKNLYRVPHATILKLSGRLFAVGALLLAPALLAVYGVLTGLYHFSLPPLALVAGGLLVLPSFCYLPIVYALYREQRQSEVLQTNIIGIGASLLLSVLLLPQFGMLGALTAGALAQWIMLAAYVLRSRRLGEARISALPELP